MALTQVQTQLLNISGDITTSAGSSATTAAATQANIVTLSKSTGVAVHGTNTNDDAAAGYVGEYLEATQTTFTAFPATGNYGDLGSITLTAGDWDITYVVATDRNAATGVTVVLDGGIGTVSGNDSTGLTSGITRVLFFNASALSSPDDVTCSIPRYRVKLTATTTYYAKVRSTYSGGPPRYSGAITARRIR